MTKPTLADATKAAADDKGPFEAKALEAAAAELLANEGTAAEEDPATSTESSLADFQSEFGREKGALYFAEGVSFETAKAIKDATTELITSHAAEIAAKDAQIEKLNTDLAAAASQILGEKDPITAAQAEEAPGLKAKALRMGSEGRARYAEKLEQKMQKS
jgi:hypothetical protein